MRIFVQSQYKSIPAGTSFNVPAFCVLTGKNGSGKTQLLEAIQVGGYAQVFDDHDVLMTKIHHIALNGLSPKVTDECDANEVRTQTTTLWQMIQGVVMNYKHETQIGSVFADLKKDFLPRFRLTPNVVSTLDRVLLRANKTLGELTEEDFFKHVDFVDLSGEDSLFASQCAMIFKAYHLRKYKNDVAHFRATTGSKPSIEFFSDEEFIAKYGPPPWELINDVLKRAGLSYKVSTPNDYDPDLPYRLRLQDDSKKVEISVGDLSSGEKVLMSLALGIYNTLEGGVKPDLLLLDEPDAPLHPEFSKLLIETLNEVIFEKAKVSVIVTTHSPSTVAMAPPGCVYEMDRNTRVPRPISNWKAVDILTEGISYLKVFYEKRRQIFVESKYDVQYFQRLFNLLDRTHSYTYQAIFLEPHSGSSNCTDVISIIEKLKASGNDFFLGNYRF